MIKENKKTNSSKGFTLIELLVVISIIGLLSSVVLAGLNTARAKARDTKRYADLKQLQTAIELYRSSNSTYPTVATFHTYSLEGCRGMTAAAGGSDWSALASLGKVVSGGYISKLPVDPINTVSGNFCYTYTHFEPGGNTAWTCNYSGQPAFDPDGLNATGGVSGPKHAYLISFVTETTNLPLPLLNNGTRMYCLLGPTI